MILPLKVDALYFYVILVVAVFITTSICKDIHIIFLNFQS